MRLIFAIDPGANPGFAIVAENDRVVWCGTGKDEAIGHFRSLIPSVVVIEKPTIYPHSKVPPNDIVTLAFTAGELLGAFHAHAIATRPLVVRVEPRTWKGSKSKELHGPEIKRYAARAGTPLDPWLASVAQSHRHDVIDAVGLGQWAAQRVRLGTIAAYG